MSGNSLDPLVLNGITFKLLNKWQQGPYIHISFSSTTAKGETKNLCAYKSRSELGFWREFVLTEGVRPSYYKGALIPITKEMGLPIEHYPQNGQSFISGIDYLQMTFIHLELQKYFNDNLDKLKIVSSESEFGKYMDPWNPHDPKDVPNGYFEKEQYKYVKGIKAHIDDVNRQEKLEPFASYAKDARNWCGVATDSRDSNLHKFSKMVERAFPEPEEPVLVYKDYEFNDTSPPDTISVTGDIYRIKLGEVVLPPPVFYSPPPLSPLWSHPSMRNIRKEIFLYFMRYNLDTESSSAEIKPLHLRNKFIPVLLTTSQEVTHYGVYSKFILAGNYICKVLNYTNRSLNTNIRSTSVYSFIGRVFENIYPYTHPKVLSLIEGKIGGKRKTRKLRAINRKRRQSIKGRK